MVPHLHSVPMFSWEMEWNDVVSQKRIYPLDLECTHTSELVESFRSSMLKSPMLTYLLYSLTTFSAKHISCILTYSIPRICFLPLSNQTREWNQPIISFSSNQTQGWNQTVHPKWNYDVTFYLVPKPNTPSMMNAQEQQPWPMMRSVD
jgi:hypothetical protein